MAKLRMKKIELIAPLTDNKKIIELIQRRGVIEICSADNELEQTNVTAITGEFERFRAVISESLEILEKYAPEKKSIADMFGGRDEIEKHEFGEKAEQLEKIMNTASEIVRNSKIISESQTEIQQLELKNEMIKPWITLDVPLNFKGTAKTTAFIGSLSGHYDYADEPDGSVLNMTGSNNILTLPEDCTIEIISSSKEQTNLFILCTKESATETEDILRKMAFVPLSENSALTAEEIIRRNSERCAELEKNIGNAQKTVICSAPWRDSLKFAVDFLEMRKDKYDALSRLGITGTTFVLNGYIPEKYCGSLKSEIESKYTAVVTYSDPTEDDDVPVMLENSKFSSPVEGITKMYAMPSKSDIDPTPVMSFFYYLFFGMMLSDAGYGILMVIGTTIVLNKFRIEESMRKTMIMFRNCGISTIFWGAMFGSWFGDIVQIVGREFFGIETGSLALWFEPLDDPIKLLLFSFGLGILHLFLGVAVQFVMTWKEGHKIGAVLDAVPVYLTVTGAAPLAASILTEVPENLKTAGTYMTTAGIILLILTAGRTSKNIFGKIFGGLYALYNTATGYLSDILSYSRLLALGLATGSIAGVINLIGTMPENKIVKLILLIVVFVVGHTANLAINLLGAYVHTDRLQFVELFSKFYTGGGREFTPFAVNTKYIRFKEEKINE